MGLINSFQNLIFDEFIGSVNKEIRAWENLWVRFVTGPMGGAPCQVARAGCWHCSAQPSCDWCCDKYPTSKNAKKSNVSSNGEGKCCVGPFQNSPSN